MRRRLTIIFASLLAVSSVGGPTWAADDPGIRLGAQPAGDPLQPIRAARPTTLSFQLGSVTGFGGVLPTAGIQLARDLTPHLGLDLTINTCLAVTLFEAGVRGYLLEYAISPFAFARAGVALAVYDDVEAEGQLGGGLGVELAMRGGFSLAFEVGGWKVIGHDIGLVHVRFTGGYRF